MDDSTEVIDVDLHFLPDPDELKTYYDEPWKTRLRDGGYHSLAAFYPSFTGDNQVAGRIERDGLYGGDSMNKDTILSGMDEVGIDKTLALSDVMLAYQALNAEDDRAVTMAKGSIAYFLDNILDPSEGIFSAIPVPYAQPNTAAEIIDDAKDEDGFVGVYLITGGAEPPLGHRKYEPIYEAAEAADLPILFHAAGSDLDRFHLKGFEKFLSTHTLGFAESNMEQLTSLVVQGIPEKFPDLDLVFLESGLFWIPMMMYRLDSEYMKRQSEAPMLEKRPSKYIEQMYFGIQPLETMAPERHLEYLFEMIGGADRLLYSSDYPHWDYDRPSVITDREFLTESEKERILSKNAKELFDL